jgi:hypothetical protein
MSQIIPIKYQELLDQFPFLTLVGHGELEYVGIMQNIDTNVASLYNYESIKTLNDKQHFLELGDEWWWETNRRIPINIIFRDRWTKFRPCLVTFTMKDFSVLHGPTISLGEINQKRVKRRSIQLVRKM